MTYCMDKHDIDELFQSEKNKEACELCTNKGWVLTFNINMSRWNIEKCDECNMFPDDESAGDQAYQDLAIRKCLKIISEGGE